MTSSIARHKTLAASGYQENASITRRNAGCCRFFTLTQSQVRGRYRRSRCFETRPSRPMRQAASNRSGPISRAGALTRQ